MDLKESELLGDTVDRHWYYRSKATALRHMLRSVTPRAALDVGAGSGFFSRNLLANGIIDEAICVDTGYVGDFDEYCAGRPIHFRRRVGPVDVDLVLMMDVLEHVDDDVAILAEYSSKVPREASFLITVPAFQFLWSAHDEFLEHRRRYTLPQLESVVHKADLSVERSAYYFAAVLPIAAAVRLAERLPLQRNRSAHTQLRQHHPMVNRALAAITSLELPLLRWNRIGGLSVFCLARRA